MKFPQYVQLLLRHWLPIALVTLLIATGVYFVSHTRPKLYTASAAEYFSLSFGASASDLAQGSNYMQDQMASFGELATSPIVLNPVIDDLHLNMTPKQLGRIISATTPRNTVILQLDVTTEDPAQAAAIANAVGARLGTALDTVGPKLPSGKSLIAVRSIQTALPPTIQSSPNTRRDTAVGFLIGLLLSSGVVIASARLDTRVRNGEILAEVTAGQLLGSVRQSANLANRGVAITVDPASRSAEDIRLLRASVEQLAEGRSTFALVVTSSIRSEGRSTLAVNLVAALAETGRRVVLVDADLRRPHVAEITGANARIGLLNVLGNPGALLESVQTMRGGYSVLAAGGSYANPAELLSSREMGSLIDSLRLTYEFVIVDAPALLDAADAGSVHKYVDGAIVVANAKRVRRIQLTSALRGAELAGLNVFGVVLNDVRPSDLPSSQTTDRGLRRHVDDGPEPAARASLPQLEPESRASKAEKETVES